MFADTDAIRALGNANSAQAADLAAVAASLSSMPCVTAGPVGARFVAALTDATMDASRAVAALSERLAAGHLTAYASATAYENADQQLADALSRY
jgi:hypothetical protein